MATQADAAVPKAADPILDWRLDQLMLAGYEAEDALLLALRGEVDLHRATSLLRSGCPAETALRILL